MTRKKRDGKRRVVNVPHVAHILLTLAAARLLKDALGVMEEAFARNSKPLPNLDLGSAVLKSLKSKLDDMLQREDWSKETLFDYNELSILYAAIHMYLVELSMTGNQQLMPTCLQLCKQFSQIMQALPKKQSKHATDN